MATSSEFNVYDFFNEAAAQLNAFVFPHVLKGSPAMRYTCAGILAMRKLAIKNLNVFLAAHASGKEFSWSQVREASQYLRAALWFAPEYLTSLRAEHSKQGLKLAPPPNFSGVYRVPESVQRSFNSIDEFLQACVHMQSSMFKFLHAEAKVAPRFLRLRLDAIAEDLLAQLSVLDPAKAVAIKPDSVDSGEATTASYAGSDANGDLDKVESTGPGILLLHKAAPAADERSRGRKRGGSGLFSEYTAVAVQLDAAALLCPWPCMSRLSGHLKTEVDLLVHYVGSFALADEKGLDLGSCPRPGFSTLSKLVASCYAMLAAGEAEFNPRQFFDSYCFMMHVAVAVSKHLPISGASESTRGLLNKYGVAIVLTLLDTLSSELISIQERSSELGLGGDPLGIEALLAEVKPVLERLDPDGTIIASLKDDVAEQSGITCQPGK